MPEVFSVYDNEDDIPETIEFRELFTEKNGKFELTGISGLKTKADIDKQLEANRKERASHKETLAKLEAWADLGDPDDVRKQLDRIPELEDLSKDGKLADEKIEELANKRAENLVKTRIAPIERENKKLAKENGDLRESTETLTRTIVTRDIHSELIKALDGKKVRPEAREDALMRGERVFEKLETGEIVTKDGVGVTPGIDPSAWLEEIAEKVPHWWPESKGTRAPGSGPLGGIARNPWSPEHWNLTDQGRYIREHGEDKAAKAAEAAGSKIGATRATAKSK